jgi:hypothetical protein
MYDPNDEERDELDRLFAGIRPATPPPDLGGRARARLRAIRGARRLTLIALLDFAALGGLAVLAYLLGMALATSDLPLLITLVTEDRGLALDARRELATAFARGVPWLYVLATTLDGLALYTITTRLLRATDALQEPPGAAR